MKHRIVLTVLLFAATIAGSADDQFASQSTNTKAMQQAHPAARHSQSPYQRQQSWYEFMLSQFNPTNFDYGRWIEQRRRQFIQARMKTPYFLYSLFVTVALIVFMAAYAKTQIDHRRRMWIAAEIMADVYNQDAYSRQIATDAITRYNNHVERCNRAIEVADNSTGMPTAAEVEKLRSELMRAVEERDTAARDRDIARNEVRKKSEILAEMSLRLEALANKSGATTSSKSVVDVHGADAKLITHINTLQEQLHAERSSNRRLKGA